MKISRAFARAARSCCASTIFLLASLAQAQTTPTTQATEAQTQQAAPASSIAQLADADIAQQLRDLLRENSLTSAIVAACMFLGLMILIWIIRGAVLGRLRSVAHKTVTKMDDLAVALLESVRIWAVGAIVFAASVQALFLPPGIAQAIKIVVVVLLGLQLLLTARRLIDFAINRALEKRRMPDGTPDPSLASGVGIIRFLATLVLGAVLVLLILTNLGIEITPLLTGLGIGGIAIALAAQNILGDLFASLTILFDKPFQVGDFVRVGDMMGTVERIGVKTTRLRSLTGEMLVIANSDLLSSRLQNFKQMQERRVAFTLDIIYETPIHKVRAIPAIVQEIIASQQPVRFDRCHCLALGAYSLKYEVVYFVLSADYLVFANTQHAINVALLHRFAQEGVEFAYPTAMEYHKAQPGTN